MKGRKGLIEGTSVGMVTGESSRSRDSVNGESGKRKKGVDKVIERENDEREKSRESGGGVEL